MSRMLEALKQIEARSSQPRPSAVTAPLSQTVPLVTRQPDRGEPKTASDESQRAESQQAEPVRNLAAMEATFTRAEQATAQAVALLSQPRSAGTEISEETISEETISEETTSSPAASEPVSTPEPPATPFERPVPGAVLPATDPESAKYYATLADKMLGQLSGGFPATLMLASPDKKSGTTCIAAPLAAALAARLDGRILLLDVDMRHPVLAEYLSVPPADGLAHVLSGMTTWQEALRGTNVRGLDFIPGVPFPSPDNRPPLRLNLQPMFREVQEQYDLTIISAPSLSYPEVAPIARYCNGTYLLVRLYHTAWRHVQDAVRAVQSHQGRILGGVVIGG